MRPFDGIRVLDLTSVLAGPFCGYQLALLGAEVIKIEAPGAGETIRGRPNGNAALGAQGMSLAFMTQASNKRFITLDLDQPAGQQAFLKLAASCDVVIENLRTGALERRGIGYEAVRALRPDVVWCAISAYGRTGPKREHPGYDSVIQAWTGLMHLNGSASDPPLKTGAPIVDYATGLSGAFAIAAALLQRRGDGQGQYIDLSMVDASLMLMASVATQTANTGKAPARSGNHASSGNPCSTTYDTTEGLLAIAVNETHQLEKLLRHLDLEALLDDPRFSADDARRRHAAELRHEVQQVLLRGSARHWEEGLNAAGVPAARVRTMDEALTEREARDTSLFHRFPAGEPGVPEGLKLPLAAFSFAREGPRIDSAPRAAGVDTESVLKEAGLTPAEIAATQVRATAR
jgi:crotonobetainyl-CoA:carnitine CoA-transferase CaiB-like acyl-CoA transferase